MKFKNKIIAIILLVAAAIYGAGASFGNCLYSKGGAGAGYCPNDTGGLIYFLPLLVIVALLLISMTWNKYGKLSLIIGILLALVITLITANIKRDEETCCWANARSPTIISKYGVPFTTISTTESESSSPASKSHYKESYVASFLLYLIIINTLFSTFYRGNK